MSKKLTPWFPASVKPVHEGVYMTLIALTNVPLERYQFWDGNQWGGFADCPLAAARNCDFPSAWQDVTWRGLAKKP